MICLTYIYAVYLVVRQIFKSEIRNGSLIAVIATSRSVGTLHKTLTYGRGQHFFSTVIELKPPNHVCIIVLFHILQLFKFLLKFSAVDYADIQTVDGASCYYYFVYLSV